MKQQPTASRTLVKPTRPFPTLKSALPTIAARTSSTPMSNSAAVALAAWEAVWVRRLIPKCSSKCLEARWVEVAALAVAVWVVVAVEVAVEASPVGSTLDERIDDWNRDLSRLSGLRPRIQGSLSTSCLPHLHRLPSPRLFIFSFGMKERAKASRLLFFLHIVEVGVCLLSQKVYKDMMGIDCFWNLNFHIHTRPVTFLQYTFVCHIWKVG